MSQDKESTGKSRTRKSTAATKKTATGNNSIEKVNASDQEQTLKIEISKYNSLINAMSGRKWLRMTISICAIGVFLFFCIFMVAFAIKKMYPYSDITTNGLGATTLKSEKGEVSYWLFNTASLWANSGISVQKGDIITIRSSGKYHTAIHHIYNNVNDNTKLNDEWIGSEGYKPDDSKDSKDYYRGQFRIFPGMPNGALIMQVVSDEPFDTPLDCNSKGKTADSDNFYYIGKERQHIYINNPGTLRFAINDIVLNRRNIGEMMRFCLLYDAVKINYNDIDSLKKQFKDHFSGDFREGANIKNKLGLGATKRDNYATVCELEYYLDENYKTAWFDDNVGSLLILIEKESR